MMERLFLGFDTSNYTTSLALCSENTVLWNRKQILSVPEGHRGLRQQEAVFQHIQNLPKISGTALPSGQVAAVGVSVRPRNAEGSYMPCFTVGESFANVSASFFNVPVFSFSHQQGHIAAGLFSSGRQDLLNQRFLAFHLSGGTTELLLADGIDHISVLCVSDDITFGQLIDRTGVLLELPFPCGKALDDIFSADIPLIEKPHFSFHAGNLSLSGFENKIRSFLEKGISKDKIVRYLFSVLVSGVTEMVRPFLSDYPDVPLLFTGGVSSNRYLRRFFGDRKRFLFAEPAFSCDNAAGVALLAVHEWRKEKWDGK